MNKAVVSDTDILIHFMRAGCLEYLGLAFSEIIIPKYIFKKEIRKKDLQLYNMIQQKKVSFLRIIDHKELEFKYRKLIDAGINHFSKVIHTGEAYCAAYAKGMNIDIIISDDGDAARFMESIVLNHKDILTIRVLNHEISFSEAEKIYYKIQSALDNGSSASFKKQMARSLAKIKENSWDKSLIKYDI